MNKIEVFEKILKPLYDKLLNCDFKGDTVEMIATSLRLSPKEEYLDYSETRKASREYIDNELKWYLSQDLSIKGHKGIEDNKIWKSCATDLGNVNSNYGYLVYSKDNYLQFFCAIESLEKNKNSRQSIIIYNRPSMHKENNDNVHAKHDFTCTMYTQFLITDNKLHMIVCMRSNDVIYGLQNDYSWQRFIYYQALNRLRNTYTDLEEGEIIWNSGSSHVYKRHFNLLKNIVEEQNERI